LLFTVQQKVVEVSTMETFAPEFSKFWLGESAPSQADAVRTAADDDAKKQTAALRELAELVSAARSIF
jgi:hypothetical protein